MKGEQKINTTSFNKAKIATKLFAAFVFIAEISSLKTIIADTTPMMWQPLPLRTHTQKSAGLAGGEGMQIVYSIHYAPSNPSIVYFVTDTSQVWKSDEGGISWQSKRNGFRSNGGISLVVDPKNENVVFVSGSRHKADGAPVSSPVDGIYRTLDGGDSWELIKQTDYYRGKEGQHFAFDPNSFDGTRHQTIYAGTHSEGLFKSTDGGDSWTYIGLNGIRILDIEFHRNGHSVVLYAATTNNSVTGNGLYKVSDDGSVMITPIGNLPDYPRTITLNAQADPNTDILYAAVGADKVFKSTDGGTTFFCSSTGLSVSNKDYTRIEMSPTNPDHLYVKLHKSGVLDPFYSHDGGATWSQPIDIDKGGLATTEPSSYSGFPVTAHPYESNVALAFLNNTIMKTANGGKTWVYSASGFMGGRRGTGKTASYFDSQDPKRSVYFLIDFGPIVTEDGGDTWRLLPIPIINGKTTPVGAVDPDNPNLMVTAVGDWSTQTIVRSIDGGINWMQSTKTDNFCFLSFNPQDTNYVYAGACGSSYISHDKGQSWTETAGKRIKAMFPANGNILYAANIDNTELLRSTDKGSSWLKIADIPFLQTNDVAIDPTDPDILYIAANSGLYRFDGTIFTEIGISNGIPVESFGNKSNRYVNTVVIDPNNPNTIYAGMSSANLGHREQFIFQSSDYGNTWEDIRCNLEGYSSVWSMAINPSNSELQISTDHGNYVLSHENLAPRSPYGLKID